VRFLQVDLFQLSGFPWGLWAPPGSFPPVPNPEIKWPSFDLEKQKDKLNADGAEHWYSSLINCL